MCVFGAKAEKETGEENWEINYEVQPQTRFNQTFVVYLLQTLDRYWTAHFVIRIWPRAKCDTEAFEEQSFQVHTAWTFELQLPQNIKNMQAFIIYQTFFNHICSKEHAVL